VLEDVVHEGLKCSGRIGKSHQHDQELKGAASCSEGCLPLMAGCDMNIVVASMEVELGVDFCVAQLVKEVCDEGDLVLILLSDLVEVLEVNTESHGAILLLIKENMCTCWKFGCFDEPLAEHVIE